MEDEKIMSIKYVVKEYDSEDYHEMIVAWKNGYFRMISTSD